MFHRFEELELEFKLYSSSLLNVGPDLCFKGESINRYLATATMSMGIVQSYPRLYWGFHFPNLVKTEMHLNLKLVEEKDHCFRGNKCN